MSEYQYYEFLALDKALTSRQREELRQLSTRAEITATRFTNEYHWGSFRGDPEKMMAKYFDAFLYLANWGTRRLMFRVPRSALDTGYAEQYCYTDAAPRRRPSPAQLSRPARQLRRSHRGRLAPSIRRLPPQRRPRHRRAAHHSDSKPHQKIPGAPS